MTKATNKLSSIAVIQEHKLDLQTKIDSILPQTQCGLCGYNGCMPYAEALANNSEAINLCPPGGVTGLLAIGELMGVNPEPYLSDMQLKAKPKMLAVIREAECIGCTKCIKACPVDAILGGPKQMHSIIATECTGCELCVAPCPVDCIDMVMVEETVIDQIQQANYYRQRYLARQKRLQEHEIQQQAAEKNPHSNHPTVADKKAYIEAALLRAKQKRKTS